MISSNETYAEKMLFACAFEETSQSWNDPFDSNLLKLITFITYVVEILAALIMLAFVVFETRGLAGHYRTLINQLLSCLYGGVRTFS